MARKGEVIENPVTRERMTFLQTSQETNGKYLALEWVLEPGGSVPLKHVHPVQHEHFEILSGMASFTIQGKSSVVEAGTVLTIPPGTPHAVGNTTEEAVVIRLEFHPALHIESFFELLYGLARDGKTNGQGAPNLLQMAVYSTAYPN